MIGVVLSIFIAIGMFIIVGGFSAIYASVMMRRPILV
jgi:hypothetical protein